MIADTCPWRVIRRAVPATLEYMAQGQELHKRSRLIALLKQGLASAVDRYGLAMLLPRAFW